MPDDGSNVGHIEPPEPMTRSSRRSRRARAKPSATATTTGTASRPQRPSGRWIACFANGEPKPTLPATGRHARRQRRGARPFRTRVRPGDEQNRARQCRARLATRPRRPITMGPSASTSAKRCPSSAGARHDARPVRRTSRGAALRDASSRRSLSARPILWGASQSVRWAQHAPRLSLCSRTGLARSNAWQRRPSSPRRDLSASPRLSSCSSCRRSMTGRRQNSHGGRTAALEEMAGISSPVI